MRCKHGAWMFGGLVLAVSLHVSARDATLQPTTLRGFGTVGALYHDHDDLEYRSQIGQARGARADEIDFETDTVAGIQLNGAWRRDVDGAIQFLTRRTAEDRWQIELHRAFVRYQVNPSLALRAGRIGWDIYPRADSRYIGYSRLGIRPAPETYGIIPTDAVDGAEALYTWPLGQALLHIKAYGGRGNAKTVNANGRVNNLDGSSIWGGHLEYVRGPWTMRVGNGVFLVNSIENPTGLIEALRQSGSAEAQSLADTFSANQRRVTFLAAGLAYDEGPVQARAFVGHTEGKGYSTPQVTTVQLIGGYDLGRITPYASAALMTSHVDVKGTGLTDTPENAEINASAEMIQAFNQYNQHSLTMGLRYNWRPGVALKAQVDRTWLRDSALVFENDRPQTGNDELTLFGLALDFIF